MKQILTKHPLITLTMGLLLAFLLALPWLYGRVKELRADSLIRQATILVNDEESREEAWERAFAAYDLTPHRLSITRGLAHVLEQADPVRAISIWEQALALSGGDVNDRINLIRAALSTARQDIASEHLSVLRRDFPDLPDTIYLQVRWLLLKKDMEGAVASVEALIQFPDLPDDYHKFYVQVKLQSPDPLERQKGMNHLLSLAVRKDNLGLTALRQLAAKRDLTADEVDLVLQGFASHPGAILEDRLMAIDVSIRFDQLQPEQYLAAFGQYVKDASADRKLTVFRWMQAHHYFQEVLQLLPLKEALSRQDLLFIRLDCMALMGQWEILQEVLQRNDVVLPDYKLHLFKVRVHDALHQARMAEIEWEKAVLAALDNPAHLWTLSQYANYFDRYERAVKALRPCSESPAFMRDSLVQLVRIYRILQDSDGIYDSLIKLHHEYPDDPEILNDLVYQQLLRGEAAPGFSTMEKKLNDNPLILPYRITVALGYMKTGRKEEAWDLFSRWTGEFDWTPVAEHRKLIYAWICFENNRIDECQSILKVIRADELLDEEMKILSYLYDQLAG